MVLELIAGLTADDHAPVLTETARSTYGLVLTETARSTYGLAGPEAA